MIVDGPADPHDILRLLGIESLSHYIVDEVQDVYRLQGVKINDKHIEVIVRQVLRRVQIEDAGGTAFIPGEQVKRSELYGANDRVIIDGKAPGTWCLTYCSVLPKLQPNFLVGAFLFLLRQRREQLNLIYFKATTGCNVTTSKLLLKV